MGRRKKEPLSCHRERIANAAEQLFAKNGIAATTMEGIAKAAQYSKPTLYVHFKNKEDIVGTLVLRSMKMLHERMKTAICEYESVKGQYYAICAELVAYQAQFPFYFEIALGEINVDFSAPEALPVEREIFEVGELLIGEISGLLLRGIKENSIRSDILIPQTVFLFWASLSGIISMAEKKKEYIGRTMQTPKQQFLDYSFEMLFRSFMKEGSESG